MGPRNLDAVRTPTRFTLTSRTTNSLTFSFSKSPMPFTSCMCSPILAPRLLPISLTHSPGGYLDPTESFEDGIISRLHDQLGVPDGKGGYVVPGGKRDWAVGDCLAVWWRPNFDTFMVSSQHLDRMSMSNAEHHSTRISRVSKLLPRKSARFFSSTFLPRVSLTRNCSSHLLS